MKLLHHFYSTIGVLGPTSAVTICQADGMGYSTQNVKSKENGR